MLCTQAIEDVKEEKRQLDQKAHTMTEENYQAASQQLCSKFYRVTGPAKCKAASKHIHTLLEQGSAPLALPLPEGRHQWWCTAKCGKSINSWKKGGGKHHSSPHLA